ncbi:MAG: hypothetical protein QOD41_3678 [Cryptosporangiaceae bacterium]|nr:hypothetical protein [Cryptosporangiaceae bacterium]
MPNPYDVTEAIDRFRKDPTFTPVPAEWGRGYIVTSDLHGMIGRLYGKGMYINLIVSVTPAQRDHTKDMMTMLSILRPLITPAPAK